MIWIWICIGLHFLWLHSFFSVFLRSSKHVCIADSCTCSETVGSESWEDWEERKYLHVLCDCCQWELRGLGGKNEVPVCVVWLLPVRAERTGRKKLSPCMCCVTVDSKSWEDWEERMKYVHVLCDCWQWEQGKLEEQCKVVACVMWQWELGEQCEVVACVMWQGEQGKLEEQCEVVVCVVTGRVGRSGRTVWSGCMLCDRESGEKWENSVKWLHVVWQGEWGEVGEQCEAVACVMWQGEQGKLDRESGEKWENSVKWLHVVWQGEWGEVGEQCEVVACCVTGRVGRSGRTVWSGCMLCDRVERSGRTVWSGCMLCDRVERSGRGAWSGCLCHVTVDRTERTAMRR